MATEHEDLALGIDLGTTYSSVGVWQGDHIEIIANDQGHRTTPSWVAFTETECLVGKDALDQFDRNPCNTIFGSKRLLGRKYRDTDRGSLPYKLEAGPKEKPNIVVEHQGEKKQFSPEQISGFVLGYLKDFAQKYTETTTITKAVITVPAHFDDSQRRATEKAGLIAGLDVMRVVDEPTAAAVAYLDLSPSETSRLRTIMVFDLGGGTFDVTILTAEGSRLEVKATAGNSFLGGDNFDDRMVTYLVGEIRMKHNVDLSKNPKSLRRLRAKCEMAKRTLSSCTEVTVEVQHDIEPIFTRAKFEEINGDLFQKCMNIVKRCMEDASLEASQIDEVVPVGGSSRIPKVRQMLHALFGGKKLRRSVNLDEAVAYGATVLATFFIGRGNRRVRDLALVDGNRRARDLAPVDRSPLSLGTSIITGGVMSTLIPRKTPIPVKVSKTFHPTLDNETSVYFDVYEGERIMAADNNFLGRILLKGLPAGKRCDEVNINVTFELDAKGTLFASAVEQDSGKGNQITILDRGYVSSEEIERLVREAASHRLEDEKRQKKAISKSELEDFISNARIRLENRNAAGELKSIMRNQLNEMSYWLKENPDAEATVYDEKTRNLKDLWNNIVGI